MDYFTTQSVVALLNATENVAFSGKDGYAPVFQEFQAKLGAILSKGTQEYADVSDRMKRSLIARELRQQAAELISKLDFDLSDHPEDDPLKILVKACKYAIVLSY